MKAKRKRFDHNPPAYLQDEQSEYSKIRDSIKNSKVKRRRSKEGESPNPSAD